MPNSKIIQDKQNIMTWGWGDSSHVKFWQISDVDGWETGKLFGKRCGIMQG